MDFCLFLLIYLSQRMCLRFPGQGSTSLAFDCPAGNRVTGLLRVVAGSVMELARYRKHVVVTSFRCNWRLR